MLRRNCAFYHEKYKQAKKLTRYTKQDQKNAVLLGFPFSPLLIFFTLVLNHEGNYTTCRKKKSSYSLTPEAFCLALVFSFYFLDFRSVKVV